MDKQAGKSGWIAFALIVVVLGLGATFLILQFTRSEEPVRFVEPPQETEPREEPVVAKEPAPPEPVKEPEAPEPEPAEEPGPPEPEEPKQPEPPPGPTPEEIARQEEEFRALMEKVEAAKLDSRWTTALNLLRENRKRLDMHVEEIDREVAKLRLFQKDAFRQADQGFGKARELFKDGQYAAAFQALQTALEYVPDVEDRQREGEELRDQIKREAFHSDMVRIRAGPAAVGDPPRTVQLKSFRIDRTEVTNEQYYMYVLATGATPPPSWPSGRYNPATARLPIFAVTHAEAVAFAEWTGKRLPTEEEWERAARYIDQRPFPWGSESVPEDGGLPCNCIEGLQRGSTRISVAPVGSFPNGGSPEGVLDLAGNVWEWTSTSVDRKDNGGETTYFVLKGGSFMTKLEACRASNRLLDEPDLRHIDVGFRCVADIGESR